MKTQKEPLDLDFLVDPKPLTIAEKALISEYIKKDKLKLNLLKKRNSLSKKKIKAIN